MSKKWFIFIILALLTINIYTLIVIYRFKQHNVSENMKISEIDELHTLQLNFETNIENNNIKLEDVSLKDSLGNLLSLNDIWKDGQKQIIVCRFSESYCESCVDFSIKMVLHWVESIGKENILFLGTYRNNRIFNKTKPMYNIHNLTVYNTVALNLPAEELGYPYYFILNSDMTISDLFVPDKVTPTITNNYLRMINKRYFTAK